MLYFCFNVYVFYFNFVFSLYMNNLNIIFLNIHVKPWLPGCKCNQAEGWIPCNHRYHRRQEGWGCRKSPIIMEDIFTHKDRVIEITNFIVRSPFNHIDQYLTQWVSSQLCEGTYKCMNTSITCWEDSSTMDPEAIAA